MKELYPMKISIIIPACNEEKYIEETLKNIPKQYEVIVVCNGCTDDTEKIAKKFPIKVITTNNRGTSLAKNIGAKQSLNEMLIFLDADIIINEKILKAIENTHYDFGTIKLFPNKKNIKSLIYIFIKNTKAKYVSGGGVIFCKKTIFNKIKGFDENKVYQEDNIFQRKAKQYGEYGCINQFGIVNLRRLEKLGYLSPIKIWLKSLIKKNIDYPIIR
mgnify:CR=1 FL=1